MKRIIGGIYPSLKRDFWALIVIPIVITIIPYGLVWAFWPPYSTRTFLTDVRFISAGFVIVTGLLCKLKIFLYEIGFLRKRENEIFVDKILTAFVYLSMGITFLFYIPVLIVLLCVAHLSKKNEVRGWERVQIIVILFLAAVFTFEFAYVFDVFRGHISLGILVVLAFCTIVVILLTLSFFSKDKRIGTGKRIVDGALFILSEVSGFVEGLPMELRGKIMDWIMFMVSNHESSSEYIRGLWTSILKFRPSKIVAGDNLGDFPIIGQLIGLKVIPVKGRRGERKGFLGRVVAFYKKVKTAVRHFLIVVRECITRKKVVKKEQIKNSFSTLRETKRCMANGILVWTPPHGRERLSDGGALKRIDPRNLRDIEVLQAVLCLGPLQYKPATKKEKTGKKWYQQQFWVSPQKAYCWILNPIWRLQGETDEEYSERIWVIMTRYKAKFQARIARKRLLAKQRKDLFFMKIARPFVRLYKYMLSFF